MKKLFLFFTFTLYLFSLQAQWQKVYNSENNYEISFPGIAEKSYNPNSGDVIYYFKGLNYFFMASVSEYKGNLQKKYSIEDIKESAFEGFSKSFNATRIIDSKIYYKNFEGWEFLFSVSNMVPFQNGMIRVILAERRMVSLIYIYTVYDNELINKFFNSLVIK
ncbi:MAG: hypothetical protein ACOYMA_14395 [Bacteroidia bacterium]